MLGGRGRANRWIGDIGEGAVKREREGATGRGREGRARSPRPPSRAGQRPWQLRSCPRLGGFQGGRRRDVPAAPTASPAAATAAVAASVAPAARAATRTALAPRVWGRPWLPLARVEERAAGAAPRLPCRGTAPSPPADRPPSRGRRADDRGTGGRGVPSNPRRQPSHIWRRPRRRRPSWRWPRHRLWQRPAMPQAPGRTSTFGGLSEPRQQPAPVGGGRVDGGVVGGGRGTGCGSGGRGCNATALATAKAAAALMRLLDKRWHLAPALSDPRRQTSERWRSCGRRSFR